MLTRIEIDGFKSFEGLDVELVPFVAILGTNAAGKSNLFDAIQLLSRLAGQDVNGAVRSLRGEPLELFRRTASGPVECMRLAAEVLIDPVVTDPWGSEVTLTHTRLRYEVTLERRKLSSGIERILVTSESAVPIPRSEDAWADRIRPTSAFRKRHLRYRRPKPFLTTERQGDGQPTFHIHQDGKQGRVRPASAAEATVLSSITSAEFPHLFALREEMRNWRLLQLDPALLRRPVPVTVADTLLPDGSNLAAVLARLKAEAAAEDPPRDVLDDIARSLDELIPGVRGLDAELDPNRNEYRIQLTLADGLPFSSRVVSDGTLRVLALMTLLHDPKHRGLVCFEEPENGVHPARLKKLVQGLQAIVTRPDGYEEQDAGPLSQFLLNSHSPVVLSALVGPDCRAHGDPVLFADTSRIVDPGAKEVRRHTRLRLVAGSPQLPLPGATEDGPPGVSQLEVQRLLDTASVDG